MPMKVFAGQQAAVPAAFVIEALTKMQKGGSTEKQVYAMGKSLAAAEMDSCPSSCNSNFLSCVAQSGAEKIEDINSGMLKGCIENHGICSRDC